MKRALLILPLLLAACAQDTDTAEADHTGSPVTQSDEMVAELGTVVGEDPGDGAVLFADQVAEDPASYEGQPVRVAGVVSEVCQMAGCWLTLRNEAGVPFRVAVPRGEEGYAFTFPKDVSGRNAVIAGTLAVEETDVETLRHFAEDEGQSPEEVAAITEPQRTIILNATGARLEGAPAEA